MSNQASTIQHASTIQEFAAELTPSQEELASTLGPAAREKRAEPETPPGSRNLAMVMRIPVSLQVVLGTASMPVADLVKLGQGAIIPLDRRVGEAVDVVVNGRIVARGEVVVMDDRNSRFGISLTQVVGPSAS
jgi:flagellar motor switch protein FliN